MKDLIKKIDSGIAKVGIIGLGYVGLPLSLAFSKKFTVIGYDFNTKTIDLLQSGKSHIIDISDSGLAESLNKSFRPTSDYRELQTCDFIIICVPTPLTAEREPDLSYIKGACITILKTLKRGQFIILESTTYPGTTDEVVVPLLEESGLEAGVDFGVAYSPERIDPGNIRYNVITTPKVVGGINEACTEIAAMLYGSVIDKIIKVRDAGTAEATKMLENIFRNVNIAVINELSLVFEKMGIDAWEVIEAASTKPYGFMSFYPGPGVGGHCIPLDPFYMSYKAKKFGFIPRFIEASGEINEFMKIHSVNLVEEGLRRANKRLYRARVAVMGLSYKKNIDDVRESPSIKIIEELANLGASVKVYDPYVRSINVKNGVFNSEETIDDALCGADCAIFVVDHEAFRGINISRFIDLMDSPVIIDCKNLFQDDSRLIYLGIGKGKHRIEKIIKVEMPNF